MSHMFAASGIPAESRLKGFGISYWVGRVAADGKAAVLAEISESAEHFQLLQDQTTTPVILDRYTIPGV